MELDFRTVRALSSRDRLAILRALLEDPGSPSEVGQRVERETASIVMELETLQHAGLVEQRRQGEMRTVYAPTEKARAVVSGGEHTVQFAMGAGTMFAVAAVAIMLLPAFTPLLSAGPTQAAEAASAGDAMGSDSLSGGMQEQQRAPLGNDSGDTTPDGSGSGDASAETGLPLLRFFAAALLVLLAAAALWYGGVQQALSQT